MKKIHLIIALLVVVPFTVSAAKVKKPTYSQLAKQVQLLQAENKKLQAQMIISQGEHDKTKRELNFCRANPTVQRVIEERVVGNITPVVQNKVPSRVVNLYMVPVAKVEMDNVRQVTGFRLQFSPLKPDDTLTVETSANLMTSEVNGDVRFFTYSLDNTDTTYPFKITLNGAVYNASVTSSNTPDTSGKFNITLVMSAQELAIY